MMNFTQDDEVLSFLLPFTFQFYGVGVMTTFHRCLPMGSGKIGMGASVRMIIPNSTIPNSDGRRAMFAAYWEDLSPQRQNSGKVWLWYDAVNHLYIVEFNMWNSLAAR